MCQGVAAALVSLVVARGRCPPRRLVGEKIVDRCHGRPALCPSSSPADDVGGVALWARKSSTGGASQRDLGLALVHGRHKGLGGLWARSSSGCRSG